MSLDQPVATVREADPVTDKEWLKNANELGHQDPRSIEQIVKAENNYCFVVPEKEQVALFSISHALEQVQIAWLLPFGAPSNEIKVPFKAGFLALEGVKEIQGYEFVGDVAMKVDEQGIDQGERVVQFWQVEWKRGGAEMTVEPWTYAADREADHWRVRCKSFADCIAVAKTWEV